MGGQRDENGDKFIIQLYDGWDGDYYLIHFDREDTP